MTSSSSTINILLLFILLQHLSRERLFHLPYYCYGALFLGYAEKIEKSNGICPWMNWGGILAVHIISYLSFWSPDE